METSDQLTKLYPDTPRNWKQILSDPRITYKMIKDYRNNKYKMANKVVDTTMAFKHLEPFQAGQYEQSLPPHVLENILHHAYNTRDTLSLWETMELIEPILHPTPGITKASRHKNFQDAKK